MGLEQWTLLTYLEAGAYIAIMLAVLGVPQMLSGYFDIRERRRERAEQEAGAERRHQEMMAMIAATFASGQEMMAVTLANSNRNGDDAIRSLQQEVASLRAEIAELRQERSNGASGY